MRQTTSLNLVTVHQPSLGAICYTRARVTQATVARAVP